MFTRAFLEAVPKTDLHVHLDGSLRLSSLIELARERKVNLPSFTEDGLNAQVFKERYADLGEYLRGFGLTCAVMQDAESLERVAYELAMDNAAENVRYVEVRFAPQLHMSKGFGYDEVLLAVDRGLDRARRELDALGLEGPPFRYGIIACALRMFQPEFSAWYGSFSEALGETAPVRLYGEAAVQVARAAVRVRDQKGVPVVGFDLAGHEAGYPAERYADAFRYAQEHFLHRTVHAGEAWGPESIYQAIAKLNADRIGHGVFLFSPDKIQAPKITDRERYCEDLAQAIADRRITVEVCLTSNLQTLPEIHSIEEHPLARMLASRLSVSICTDNRLVSHTTVTRELELATAHFPMSPKQLRDIVIYGFKRSFFPGSYQEKRAYVRRAIEQYDRVAAAHGVG